MIIRNRAHLDIDFMFLENSELVPAEEVCTAKALSQAAGARAAFLALSSAAVPIPNFWASSDFFNAPFGKLGPINAGILDLSLYPND